MTKAELETTGAWIVHHGLKLQADQSGASEFPTLDGAAKCGMLLAGMASSDQIELSREEVFALAKTARLNPKSELPFALSELKKRQVIDVAANGAVSVLGVSSRVVLKETARLFDELEPGPEERAAIDIAESTSASPRLVHEEAKRLSEQYEMNRKDAEDFLHRSQSIGFVDSEGEGISRILFNGNLFRRDGIEKSKRIIDSLTSKEQQLISEVSALLGKKGCVDVESIRHILGTELFDKLRAAGFYDVQTVSNDQGEHVYVTSPSAFHKFVDPLVDDAFDMAKALVAALTYGIAKSDPGRGRITLPSVLISKLVSGTEIGPATAIGQDYRVLEAKRVIKLRHAGGGRYFMRLLKRDIGELALKVLLQGDASEQVLDKVPTASMTAFRGPEEERARLRRSQKPPSRKHTENILQALREQGGTW